MFWFDKQDERALFVDKRRETWPIDIGTPGTKGRSPIVVDPDELADFTALPYPDDAFALVVFDPPHIERTEAKGRQWRPSIHMPRWASRITLEITGVRIERLQGISENDAKAEGVEHYKPEHTAGLPACSAHRYAFEDLWRDINGPGSWEDNPWVWVVEFKRIQP